MMLAEQIDLDRLQQSLQRMIEQVRTLQLPAGGDFVSMAEGLGLLQAGLLLIIGAIYLLYGYRVFQALVIVNAAIIGLLLGMFIGQAAGAPLVGALIGSIALAILAWPLLKAAVVLMSALVGGAVGYAVWLNLARAHGGDPNLAWIGGAIGLAALGVLAVVLFRPTIIIFTCLQGAVLAGAGILGLLFLNDSVHRTLAPQLTSRPYMLELCLLLLAVAGFFFQFFGTGRAAKTAPANAGA